MWQKGCIWRCSWWRTWAYSCHCNDIVCISESAPKSGLADLQKNLQKGALNVAQAQIDSIKSEAEGQHKISL